MNDADSSVLDSRSFVGPFEGSKDTHPLQIRSGKSEADIVVRRRKPLQWISVLVLGLLVAMVVQSSVNDRNFEWNIVGKYLFNPRILAGVRLTIELTFACMAIGLTLGTILAVMRLSSNPVLATVAKAYTWFFRGTPVLVQLIFWYNLGALFPRIGLGVPFGPTLISGDTNNLLTPLAAALLGLGLNEAAYMSEIVHGGVLSVPRQQYDAAASLGLTSGQTMRQIVLPQATRVIVPAAGNDTIAMLKYTSLVSIVALSELLYSAESIYNQNYQTIPLLIVASIWYLGLTTVLTIGQIFLERRFGRSVATDSSSMSRIRFRYIARRVAASLPSGTADINEDSE